MANDLRERHREDWWDSFSYAIADSVDSPASIFSAMGVKSRDFSGENMKRNWDSFSKEAVQIGGGFVNAPGSLVAASANIVKEINPSEGGEAAVQGLNNVLRADQPRVAERYLPRTEVRAVQYAPQVVSPSPLHWDGTVYGPLATHASVQILPPPRVLSGPIHQAQSVRVSYATGHPGVMGAPLVQNTRYSSPGIRLA